METSILNHSFIPSSPGGTKQRIKCHGSTIKIGNREFISATEALQAYLDQYAGITVNRQKYERSVEDLLNPKSVLHMTADRSLQTGVRDTVKEMKLAEAKEVITENYDRLKASDTLREQVEDALNRSGQLLQRIVHDDDKPATISPQSEIDSLPTDILMSMNPVAGYSKDFSTSIDPDHGRRHVYSYRTPRPRSKTVGSVSFNKDQSNLMSNTAMETKVPPTSFRSRFKPPGSINRERSRSEPPSALRNRDPLATTSTQKSMNRDYNIDNSTAKAPSWVEALDITNPMDTLWTKRDLMEGRPPPSWIQDMDKSDISSVTSGCPRPGLHINDLLPMSYGNTSLHDSLNLSSQALTYRDLVTGTPLKSKMAADLLGQEKQRLDKYDLTSRLPKEVKQSGQLDLSSSEALDRYLDGLGCKKEEVPRCSSLDTEALIAGMCAPAGSDITGASPIFKDNTPKCSPARPKRPSTPDTDIVLDGDRPWEKPTVTFKSPVFMDDPLTKEESSTLTGGQQPGSLEALKNMLFKLQCEASGGSSAGNKEKIQQILSQSGMGAAHLEEEIPALKGYNYMEEPGGQSLEKALIHLSKLKSLVQTGPPSDATKKQPLGNSIT